MPTILSHKTRTFAPDYDKSANLGGCQGQKGRSGSRMVSGTRVERSGQLYCPETTKKEAPAPPLSKGDKRKIDRKRKGIKAYGEADR